MMLRCLHLFLTFFVVTSSVQAAQRELTIFSDGRLVEIETTVNKGLAELALPAPIRDGTLRVKALGGGSIGRVELIPFRLSDKLQKELDGLQEQKNRQEDRLKALETREGIFEAAAKSQSSKAPRKTKTNPDPLASVRQGTDFAIAQLEAVFTARRRSEQELKRITARIAQLHKNSGGGPTVRAEVTPGTTRVRVAAVLSDNGWRPRYELRLTGNGSATAVLIQLAEVDGLLTGFSARVAPASLTAGPPEQTYPLLPGPATRLATWQLPIEHERVTAGPLPSFTVTLKNTATGPLPGGLVAVYSQDEYLGTVTLPATAANAVLPITNRP
jgi:hypothetical protein